MRAALIVLLLIPAWATADERSAADWLSEGDAAFARKDWDAAAGAYREAARLHELDGRASFRLGYALHSLSRWDEAIEAYEQAARSPKARPAALYNLACAHCRKGDTDAAFANLEQAVGAGYRSARRLSDDADLAALGGDARFLELEQRALPAKLRAVYRQFDFWVGRWEVKGRSGQKVGSSVVTSSQSGFLITENWTNAQGSTGSSVNFYDPADGRWHQIWVDAGGNVTRYAGGWKDGKMRFEGIAVTADGGETLCRMDFEPRPDGTVRQQIRQSKDGGESWNLYFDGIYRKPGK